MLRPRANSCGSDADFSMQFSTQLKRTSIDCESQESDESARKSRRTSTDAIADQLQCVSITATGLLASSAERRSPRLLQSAVHKSWDSADSQNDSPRSARPSPPLASSSSPVAEASLWSPPTSPLLRGQHASRASREQRRAVQAMRARRFAADQSVNWMGLEKRCFGSGEFDLSGIADALDLALPVTRRNSSWTRATA